MRQPRWPVWAVLCTLIAAALACSFNFSTAKIKSVKMVTDDSGKTETQAYGTADTFFCIVELTNAPDDTKTKAVWTAVQVAGVEPNFSIGEYELESGSGVLTFQVSPQTDWPVGQYKVEIYLNGEKKETLEFEVR
ncbi:MAG: hypothetical protein JW910_21355 [Anaerolineae bacterium]|nr:hypothetical protein [Anaerolineae bacterium]